MSNNKKNKTIIEAQAGLRLNAETASRALVTDASKNLVASVVTSTELANLSGTTSNIQNQLNEKTSVGSYYLSNVASDSGGGRYDMTKDVPAGGGFGFSVSGAGSGTLIASFATLAAEPNLTLIPEGLFAFEVQARKTAGTTTAKLYAEIYSRDTLGNNTLLGTTGLSNALTGSNSVVSGFIFVPINRSIVASDRLLVSIYVNVSGVGTNPDVTMDVQGLTSSRMGVPFDPYALSYTAENVVNKVTNLSAPDNTTYPTTQAVVTAITGNVNTPTYFNSSGALASIPSWNAYSDGTVSNYITYDVPDNSGGTIKLHSNETELTSDIDTTAWSFYNNTFDMHFDRSAHGFNWDNGISNISMNTSMEGTGAVTYVSAINSGLSLGVGSAGNTTNAYHMQLGSNIGTNYVLGQFSGISNGLVIDPTATLTNGANMHSVNVQGNVGTYLDMFTQVMTGNVGSSFRANYNQFDGNANGAVGGFEFNYSGTITGNSFNGSRISMNGTADGYTGSYLNLQGTINNQAEQLTLNNSATIGGSYFVLNGGNSGNITNDFFLTNYFNNGSANSVRGFNFSNSGTLNQFFNGVSLSNSGINDQSQGFTYFDNSSSLTSKTGVLISLSGDAPNINALSINVSGATSTNRKQAATFEGGTLNYNMEYESFSSSPYLVDPVNVLLSTLHVVSGTPITGTDPLNWLMGANLVAEDDLGTSAFGLGFVSFGNVGQTAITVGKTVTTWTGNVTGFSVPDLGQGVGDMTNAYIYRSVGAIPGGGSINIANLYNFYVDPLAVSMAPTNAWGFYNDANCDNFVNKLAINTGSKKISGTNLLELDGGTVSFTESSIGGTNLTMFNLISSSTVSSFKTLSLLQDTGDANFKIGQGIYLSGNVTSLTTALDISVDSVVSSAEKIAINTFGGTHHFGGDTYITTFAQLPNIRATDNTNAIDINNRNLLAADATISADWQNRLLKSIDGTTTVLDYSNNGIAVFPVHIRTAGAAPSIVVDANAGVGASASVGGSSTDTAGAFTINTGTGAIAGTQATITFNVNYQNNVYIQITPTNGNSAVSTYFVLAGNTAFTLEVATALTDSSTYTYTYQIIEQS